MLFRSLRVDQGTAADERRRETVRKAAGYDRRPSDASWRAALDVLEVMTREQAHGSACSICGWPVLVVRKESGGEVLLDPYAHPAGNVAPQRIGDVVVAQYITGTTTPPEGADLFRQHHNSCPGTKRAAERRRKEAPTCAGCREPLDGTLAHRDPTYTRHPQDACHPERR